jgi:hypothetical protein
MRIGKDRPGLFSLSWPKSAPSRLENPDSDKKEALFDIYTQITISILHL